MPIWNLNLVLLPGSAANIFFSFAKTKMEPPKTPAQLAAQKHEVVEAVQDIAEKHGIGGAYPVLTLVTNGKAPDDEPSKKKAGEKQFCQ